MLCRVMPSNDIVNVYHQIWLVSTCFNPSVKILVNWDDNFKIFQIMIWKNKKCSKPSTRFTLPPWFPLISTRLLAKWPTSTSPEQVPHGKVRRQRPLQISSIWKGGPKTPGTKAPRRAGRHVTWIGQCWSPMDSRYLHPATCCKSYTEKNTCLFFGMLNMML